MKVSITRFVLAAVLSLLAFGASAQEGIHLSVYCSPANHDYQPGAEHVSNYSIYLTERGSQTLEEIQAAVLADPQILSNYVYICHPVFWNTECGQYATLDMTEDATDETLLDGRYECTSNTVAIVTYENGTDREVQVIPSCDPYFPEFFDDTDWDYSSTGWTDGGETPESVDQVENASFTAYAAHGTLVVKCAQRSKVEVYSVGGTLVATTIAASDESRIQLPSIGAYVVRVDGRSLKVMNR